MAFRLLYHDPDLRGAVSPFDRALLSITTGDDVRLACPYISLPYLERLIRCSASWRLLTDVEEWLRSESRKNREDIFRFLVRYEPMIRHCHRLHAKVAVGSRAAMLGSANFTDLGIRGRTEMSIMIEEEPHIRQLTEWFETYWARGQELRLSDIRKYLKTLPEDAVVQNGGSSGLFDHRPTEQARLVEIPELPMDGKPRYWCLNFDLPEVLEHGLRNGAWMMQYQYSHDRKPYQGHKIRAITNNWRSAARIKPRDWCLAYLKGNKFFATGEVVAPRKAATHHDTVERTLRGAPGERRHLYYDGIVYYTDAAGGLYENHTDVWRVGLGEYSYAQRVDVAEWRYRRRGGDASFCATCGERLTRWSAGSEGVHPSCRN